MTWTILLFLICDHAVAASKFESEEVNAGITWVDSRGKTFPFDWPIKVKSEWINDSSGELPEKLTQRVTVDVSDELTLKRSTKRDPLGLDINGNQFSFDTNRSQVSSQILFLNKLGKEQEVGFAFFASRIVENKFEHAPSCEDLGIQISPLSGSVTGFFLGGSCSFDGESFSIFVQFSEDLKVERQRGGRAGKGWVQLKFNKLEKNSKLGSFSVSEIESKKKSDFEVSLSSLSKKNFRLIGGLAPTYFSYHENTNQINLNQFSLTGKLSASGYVRRKVFLGGNIFSNLLTLSKEPSSLEETRIVGFNFRAGYPFHITQRIEITPSLGWYLWKMIVKGGAYGIKTLAGPHLIINFAFSGILDNLIGGYLKFTPLAASADSFSLVNSEIAAGGSYQINSSRSRRPVYISIDFSTLSIQTTNRRVGSSSISLGLGIQIN